MSKKSPSGQHCTICRPESSQRWHVSTVGKYLLNNNIFFTRPHNMTNFDPLAAEIGSGVWGTPANFNGFRVLASLLQRCPSTEANQTLHDIWPSPALLHYYMHFMGRLPLTEFRHVQNSLCVQVLRSPILAALLHGTPAAGSAQLCGFVQGMELRNFHSGRYLYSAGRPSRWASADILVLSLFFQKCWEICEPSCRREVSSSAPSTISTAERYACPSEEVQKFTKLGWFRVLVGQWRSF